MATTTQTTLYEARGAVRGSCGHKHRTLGAAFRCMEKDQRACASLGGGSYSDRGVARLDGEELGADDVRELEALATDW